MQQGVSPSGFCLPGFSLIEVLIALMMVSITITSLLTLQNTLQTMLFKDNSQWHAEQLAMQAFVDAEKQQPAEPGKAIEREQDDFKIVYSVLAAQEGTPLAEIKDLVIEKVVVSWTKIMATQTFTLIKYSYRPKPSEKEKNKEETVGGGQEKPEQKSGEAATATTQAASNSATPQVPAVQVEAPKELPT